VRFGLVCLLLVALGGSARAGAIAAPALLRTLGTAQMTAPGAGPALAPGLAALAAPSGADSGAVAPPPPQVRAWQVGLLRPDRLEHATLSFTLALGAGAVTRQPAAAAGGVLALGLAKEVRDRRHAGFDLLDLLADAVGAGLAAWAATALRR
jgi:hypothetical protein